MFPSFPFEAGGGRGVACAAQGATAHTKFGLSGGDVCVWGGGFSCEGRGPTPRPPRTLPPDPRSPSIDCAGCNTGGVALGKPGARGDVATEKMGPTRRGGGGVLAYGGARAPARAPRPCAIRPPPGGE